MPTDTKQESRRETAKRLVNERAAMSGDAYTCDLKLIDAIEAALKERDERAVRVIAPLVENHKHHCTNSANAGSLWIELENAIRNEDTK